MAGARQPGGRAHWGRLRGTVRGSGLSGGAAGPERPARRSRDAGKSKARSVTWILVCDVHLLRHKPGETPVREFRDIREDMGL